MDVCMSIVFELLHHFTVNYECSRDIETSQLICSVKSIDWFPYDGILLVNTVCYLTLQG